MSKPANANDVCVGPTSQNAGKASTCDGCPNQNACSSGKYNNTSANNDTNKEIGTRLESVKNILLVLSGKGGVGKSTVSSQIAWTFAHWGLKVGILDIDICGPSIARMMGVEDEEVHRSGSGWEPVNVSNNLCVMSVAFMLPNKNDAIIWRGPRKTGLIKQFLCDVSWNNLDYLIIDCPPGTSDEHISITSFILNSKKYNKNININALIVSTPQEVSLLDVRKEISFCNKVRLNILGIVENMKYFVCNCCGKKQKIFYPNTGGARNLSKRFNIPYLSGIPIDSNLLRITEKGKGYIKWANKYCNNKNNKTRIALIKLCKEILRIQYNDKYKLMLNNINNDNFNYYSNDYDSNDDYTELSDINNSDNDNDIKINNNNNSNNNGSINNSSNYIKSKKSKKILNDSDDDDDMVYQLD